MFAKPNNASKKPAVAVKTKSQPVTKAKTIGSKTGVKPQPVKKSKQEKNDKQRPAPRVEAGYSLYSNDSGDQVTDTFKDMEMCEKILTHLKSKQKGKVKSKSPKKLPSPPKPKALNEVTSSPQRAFSPGYGFPYGAATYLQHFPPQHEISQTANPVFNFRLASSTPDPDKHLNDHAGAAKLPSNIETSTQEIPERDISAVSSKSNTPTLSHLRNMADMINIYKQLEVNKAMQLQDETGLVQIEKQGEGQSESETGLDPIRRQVESQRKQLDSQASPGQTVTQSGPVTGTGSLGFLPSHPQTGSGFMPSHPQTGFLPIQSSSESDVLQVFSQLQPSPSTDQDDRRESNITAFQPYISRDSLGFQPPLSWYKETVSPQILKTELQQNQSKPPGIEPLPLSQQPIGEAHESREQEEPLSGRSEKSAATSDSRGTDYTPLPRPDAGNQIGNNSDSSIVYQKENGLYQIHRKTGDGKASSHLNKSESSKLDLSGAKKSPVRSDVENQLQNKRTVEQNIHEAPERDVPQNTPQTPQQPAGSHTFSVEPHTHSQNISEISTTPRNQDTSGTGSSGSSHGKLVFIPTPNDSNTQNVIGYIPGVPIIPGSNQPISLPVAYGLNPTQVAQLANQTSGSSGSQVIGGNQGQQQVMSQNISGSSYHSVAHSQAVAAGDIGTRKLRYLLKELRECTKVTKDVEVSRLVKEIDSAVDTIPQLGVTFNLQTEIDLAIQPLRSENSQLRRKLRLVNQQLKDKEIEEGQEPKDVNFEILHLQTSKEVLQKTIREEKEIKTRLAAEVQFLMEQIHKMKVERAKAISEVSEKETEQLKQRQESLLDTQKLRHELDLMKKDYEAAGNKLESLEKENHILQITLQQRDTEIDRQQELLETMKENIGELLHELDQTRSGDKTWDHNQSFGLHKLLKIVDGESSMMPGKEQKQGKELYPPEKRKLAFASSEASTELTPRLTRAALASHNRDYVGPTRRQGPASESEINTLVEMENNPRKLSPSREAGNRPKHRRTSSLSPVRLKNGHMDFKHHRTSSTPIRQNDNRLMHKQNTDDLSRFRYDRYRKENAQATGSHQSPGRRPLRPSNRNDGERLDFGASEVSVDQSRYSVTDYFNKYHASQQPVAGSDLRSRPPIYRSDDSKEMYDRGGSQPVLGRHNDIDDRTLRAEAPKSRNIKQLTLFKGTNYDTTISAIQEDDNISSVSMTSVSTANTNDDKKFRNGIAQLDANIAKLQMALQKTKSMLS